MKIYEAKDLLKKIISLRKEYGMYWFLVDEGDGKILGGGRIGSLLLLQEMVTDHRNPLVQLHSQSSIERMITAHYGREDENMWKLGW